MHEGRRLEQVGVPFPADVCRRDLAQMWIDERHELLEDGILAALPLREKQGDLSSFRLQTDSTGWETLGFLLTSLLPGRGFHTASAGLQPSNQYRRK